MARRPRQAAQAAAISMRKSPKYNLHLIIANLAPGNRIPDLSDNEDELMVDPPATDAATPREEEDGDPAANDDEVEDAEDDATPSQASPQPSRSATPRRRGRGGRARRGGTRSTRNRPPASEDDTLEVTSDAPPKKRGGFRGGNRGRWANRKSGISRNVPLDEDGNPMEVEENELVLPELPEGEAKVAKSGELLGGREYRVRTFTIPGHGDKLYMLSTEPARCLGYRDSYLFFTKHKMLYKVLVAEDEKVDLIERGMMPNSYKGRSIGIVTARSVFREFGARIVVGGKRITDDYDESAARERGDVEGELADPRDQLPPPGVEYDRNQYVAWFGASNVYHKDATNAANAGKKGPEGKRKRIIITSDNWLFEHARSTSQFNSTLAQARKTNFKGLYDIHTNVMQWPQHMQSTHARWEKIIDEAEDGEEHDRRLPGLKPVYSRNFRIHDFAIEAPPDSNFAPPGMEYDETSLGSIPREVLDELPLDCLEALQQARAQETGWRTTWGNEKLNGMRANFLPSLEWYPKT